ncbi:hypothetical protein [Demequina sp.]|uniref:hypothetical protein n=1 Tax=Demequina sp. TaxID=2050685 RepID=UPI003A8AA1C5
MAGETNWLTTLIEQTEVDKVDRELLHSRLVEQGLLSRVTLVKVQCRARRCQIATVFRVGPVTMCAVRDYKYSPGLNAQRSVPRAREKNTLDGDHHWPGHVYDVNELAHWGVEAGFDVVCRHAQQTINAAELLGIVQSVEPGKPLPPIVI